MYGHLIEYHDFKTDVKSKERKKTLDEVKKTVFKILREDGLLKLIIIVDKGEGLYGRTK